MTLDSSSDLWSHLANYRHAARRWLRPRLGIDTRALGALRISLGVILLADLAMRSLDLVAFYSDAGVLPRAALSQVPAGYARLSLHALSGTVWVQWILFGVAAIVALALLAGVYTRGATIGAFGLTASLYARNLYVLNGGDKLLVVFLLLGIFLPLGERWSVDAVRRTRAPRPSVLSVATATLLVHLVIVYETNAIVKLRSDLWTSGVAVRYVFSLDRFTVFAGDLLAAWPPLLVLVNWIWLAMLVGSVLLVLTTGRRRTTLAGLFVGAHLGMAFTLRLGLFPFIVIAGLLCVLPTEVWTRLERSWAVRTLDRWVAAGSGRLVPSRRLPTHRWVSERWDVGVAFGVDRGIKTVGAICAGGMLVLALVAQAAALGYVDTGEDSRWAVDLADYSWTLFAPQPPTADGWYVVPATLASGDRVDLLHLSPVTWDRPPDVADAYPSTLWHRYLSELRHGTETEYRYLAAYLCRRGAAHYGVPVKSLTVTYVAQHTRLSGPEPITRVTLYRTTCPGGGRS